jgi:aconitase B
VAEYFEAFNARIAPKADKVYKYLQFDELPEYQAKPAKHRAVA